MCEDLLERSKVDGVVDDLVIAYELALSLGKRSRDGEVKVQGRTIANLIKLSVEQISQHGTRTGTRLSLARMEDIRRSSKP